MRFEEAMYYVRQGKKIRRKAWGKYCYVTFGLIVNQYNQAQPTLMTMWNNEVNLNKAIFEEDWEVVDG
jgi:hypothetical protein